MKKRYKLQELSLDKFKNQVIDALCADRDFWFNDFEDVCDNYGIDSSQFYDKNGNMFDRREVAGYLLDNIDCLYDLADKYGIFNEDFYQDILENIVRTLLKESNNYEDDEEEELDPFEEYQQDYPNGDFDVSDMTPQQLAKWCQNAGDFLYVYNGLRGWAIMAANIDSIVYDIVSDLYNCERIEPTHEVDYLFSSREREFENDYVCIFKVIGTKDGDYYVVYQQDKCGRGNIDLDESKQTINEAFKSNELRNWFKLHGGVKKVWEDFPEMNVTQDGLGDVTDDDITYLEEFPNIRDARKRVWDLNHEKNNYGQRSERNIKNLYTMYKANDGYCLVVGLNRNNIETGVNWGGEYTKKKSNRIWRDDKDPESYRAGKYVDDKGKYYYSRKGQDFGLRTNKDFKGKMSDNNNIRNRMSDKQWKDYQTMRVNDMNDYLNRYYGKGIK